MAETWLDFKNFPAKVAELNRLYKELGELSDLRLRTGDARDVARWEDAARRLHELEERKFHIFESARFLEALATGEAEARKCAIKFLEFDPYYFRSGYMKAKLLTRLKHLVLTPDEVCRLQCVVVAAILAPLPKCEFKYYARLLTKIGSPEFREQLRTLRVPDIPYLQARRARCLQVLDDHEYHGAPSCLKMQEGRGQSC